MTSMPALLVYLVQLGALHVNDSFTGEMLIILNSYNLPRPIMFEAANYQT